LRVAKFAECIATHNLSPSSLLRIAERLLSLSLNISHCHGGEQAYGHLKIQGEFRQICFGG